MEDPTKKNKFLLYDQFKMAVEPFKFEINPSEWPLLWQIHQFFCSHPEQEMEKDELYYIYFFNLLLSDHLNIPNLHASIMLLSLKLKENQQDLSYFPHLTRYLLHLSKGQKRLHSNLLNALPLCELKIPLFNLPSFELLISYHSESAGKNALLDDLLFELWTAKNLTEINDALNNEQRNIRLSTNEIPQTIPKNSITYKLYEGCINILFKNNPSTLGKKLALWLGDVANELAFIPNSNNNYSKENQLK